MHNRILEVRKSEALSRAAFGERIGVSGDVINNLERGRVEIKDHIVKLICREFNVNEEWLRNGIGEMYIEMDDEDRMMEDLGRILGSGSTFQKRFVRAFLTMTDAEWQLAERKLKEILGIEDSEN